MEFNKTSIHTLDKLSVNAHINMVTMERDNVVKYRYDEKLSLEKITVTEILHDINTKAYTAPLVQYKYNKFFKIYSRLPFHLIPILPSDLVITDFIQTVIDHNNFVNEIAINVIYDKSKHAEIDANNGQDDGDQDDDDDDDE